MTSHMSKNFKPLRETKKQLIINYRSWVKSPISYGTFVYIESVHIAFDSVHFYYYLIHIPNLDCLYY